MDKALTALQRLVEGNRRFRNGAVFTHALTRAASSSLAAAQSPFAIILGCSDSRVPVELVFDQGLGDLFVIRVAGNVVAPSQIGSIEFAVESFGTGLVVVLGHSDCGAVLATLEELARPAEDRSVNLAAIVDRIRPAVLPLLQDNPPENEQLVEQAVNANTRLSMQGLVDGSSMIKRLVEEQKLLIVGAQYSLSDGAVTFLDIPD